MMRHVILSIDMLCTTCHAIENCFWVSEIIPDVEVEFRCPIGMGIVTSFFGGKGVDCTRLALSSIG